MPRSIHFCFPVYLFHFVLFLVISLVESSAWKLISAVSEISNRNFFYGLYFQLLYGCVSVKILPYRPPARLCNKSQLA